MTAPAPQLAQSIAKATFAEIQRPERCDAIVVGAGAAGGLAAELLTEAGLQVLVLDAGLRQPFWRAPVRRAVSTTLATLATPQVVRRLPASLLWKAQRAAQLVGRLRQP